MSSRSSRSRSSRRNNHGSVLRGRILLLVLFVALEGLDLMLYFGASSTPITQHRILGGILIRVLWSVVCVIAMWQRHNWARYLLFIRLLWSAVMTLMIELGGTDRIIDNHRYMLAVFSSSGHLIVAIILMAAPSIRKLTHPDQYFDLH